MPPDAAHPSLPTPGIHATLDQMSVGDNNSGPPTPRQQHSGHPLRGLPIPPPPPPSHAAGVMAGPSAGSYPPSPSYPPGAAPHGRGGHRHHAELHSPLHPSQEYAEMMDRNHLGGHYGGPPPPSQQQHMDYPPPPALGYGSHQLVSLFRVSLPRPFCEGFSRANPPPHALFAPRSLLLHRHYITATLFTRSSRTRRNRCNRRIRSNLACTGTLLPKRNRTLPRSSSSNSSSICTLIPTRLISIPRATPRITTRTATRTISRLADLLINRRSGDRPRTGTFRSSNSSSRRFTAVPRRRRRLLYRVRVCIRADRSMRICRC